jgi:hypothetical protein
MKNHINKKLVDSASETEIHSNPNSGSYCSNNATDAVYKNQEPVVSNITTGECRQPRQEEEQRPQPDWWHVVNRIDHLEQCLGHRAELSDLYDAQFQTEEIDIAKELLPSLFKSESEKEMMECSQEAEKAISMKTERGRM